MLQKTPIEINFSQGLNLKADPKQVKLGQFLSLQNSIFDKGGLLQKRNGFAPLTALPDTTYAYVTTLNEGLVAIGNSLSAYSEGSNQWINKGNLKLLNLSTLPLVRNSSNQTRADSVTAANGLVCTAYIDVSSSTTYKYAIIDSTTGQAIINPTTMTAGSGTINSSPRVFLLGNYFIIAFGTSTNHIQYVAIPTATPTTLIAAQDLLPGGTTYTSASTISWDAVVYADWLYVAWNTTAGGQNIKMTNINSNLSSPSPAVLIGAAQICTMISLAVDSYIPSAPKLYLFWYDLAGQTAHLASVAINAATITPVVASTALAAIATTTLLNVTCTANNNLLNLYYETSNQYTWSVQSNFVSNIPVTISGTTPTIGSAAVILRGVGLGSKAFTISGTDYMLTVFGSSLQPTAFVIDGTGQIISRFAYQNGGGYLALGLPGVTVSGTTFQIPYLYKDLIAAQAKPTPATTTVQTAQVYSQTGVNLLTIELTPNTITSSSIGSTLNVSGGMLWTYDGVSVTEQGFSIYPDDIPAPATATTGGFLTAQIYYYQAVYEWTDNNGNVNRSAPSIPVIKDISGSETSTNTITVKVPTLRETYKTNVRIVLYRWSTAQQVYYAITAPSAAPTLSSTTTDSVTIVDTASDATILGNPILYTTGGVIENIAGPATNLTTLFNNRLFLVDAEDTNLLWYSKQVIEATPVEMSDLLTLYVAPTTGAQGSTGPIRSMSPMDDKLILFKKDAIYYINGIGPDNTGANSQYSDAIFISSVVGCANQNSIVFTPNGLMFQSDKGIWLLGRDLSTSYIGAPVQDLTLTSLVKTALNIPGTNQVRFTLDSGITLMYDYYYGQWGTFVGISGIASTLYNSLHTYINDTGLMFQETPGTYTDNGNPVLMQFTTGWGNLAGLQGYERLYFLYLLGQYITPFQLRVTMAYNYDPTPIQSITVQPDNNTPNYGLDSLFGGTTPFGGPSQVFEARIFPEIQKCESFQVSIQEIYDSSFGVLPGQGLSMSGLSLITGVKKGYRTQSSAKSFG